MQAMFPTLVGMNRIQVPPRRAGIYVPHTRGDEPLK